MYRWNAFEEREILVQNITTAMEHVARCFAGSGHAIIVLAHSAGGILASYASGRVRVPEGVALPDIFILTVASPLSLVPIRPGGPKEEYLRDLATSLPPYPTPARGIAVIHLRTSYPADHHMKPLSEGGLPNDPNIGVGGAAQISIPPELSHDASILYATKHIVSGEWTQWLPVQWQPVK